MSFRSPRVWRFASELAKGTIIFATTIYVSRVARRIYSSSQLGVVDENDVILASFMESNTIQNYVNPQKRGSRAVDMHTVTLNLPLSKGLSDETILAQATKHFFNGWVFYPEAKVLSLVKLKDSQYSKLSSTTVPAHVWDAATLSETSLPELNTVLFGVFRLADIHLAGTESQPASETSTSHADFIFGSDMTKFAGCHRLSVERQEVDPVSETQKLKIQFQSYACNPQSDAPAGSIILAFHRLYASALFRETVGQLNRGLNPDDGTTGSSW